MCQLSRLEVDGLSTVGTIEEGGGGYVEELRLWSIGTVANWRCVNSESKVGESLVDPVIGDRSVERSMED